MHIILHRYIISLYLHTCIHEIKSCTYACFNLYCSSLNISCSIFLYLCAFAGRYGRKTQQKTGQDHSDEARGIGQRDLTKELTWQWSLMVWHLHDYFDIF